MQLYIITPFRLFKFSRIPFGVKNTALAFRHQMDTIYQSLDFAFAYIDDMFTNIVETHNQNNHLLFQWHLKHGLVINISKCQFIFDALDFLAHCMACTCIFSATRLLRHFEGNGRCNSILTHPHPNAHRFHLPPILQTWQFELQQFVVAIWLLLALLSQKLRPSERKDGAFNCELPALYLAIQHFCYLLEGRKYIAFINYNPLTFCMSTISEPMSIYQQCHLQVQNVHLTCTREE